VHVIAPTSGLPILYDAVTIDGYTQPGSAVNTLSQGDNAKLLIEVSGAMLPGGDTAFLVEAPATIRGLIINGWQDVKHPEIGASFASFLKRRQ
jgi:hypothetical protein